MPFFYLFLAFTLNSVANVMLKIGARGGGGVLTLFKNPLFLGGAALFALNIVFYYLALRALPLSVAYPVMLVMSFLLVNGYAVMGLGEKIAPLQLVGYGLVIAGIILIFYFSEKTGGYGAF